MFGQKRIPKFNEVQTMQQGFWSQEKTETKIENALREWSNALKNNGSRHEIVMQITNAPLQGNIGTTEDGSEVFSKKGFSFSFL